MERKCTIPFKDLLVQQLQQSELSISDITQSHHERFLRSCGSIVSLGSDCRRVEREVLSGVERMRRDNISQMVERSEALRGLTKISNQAKFMQKALGTAMGVARSMRVAEEAAEEGRLKEALEEVSLRDELL